MTPPAWLQAVTASTWAATTLVAAVATLALPSCRRSPWVAVWPPLSVAATWWAWLNVERWTGGIDTAEYRAAVAPLVPALFVLLAWTAAVFVVRAVRTDRIESTFSGVIHDARERYSGDQ